MFFTDTNIPLGYTIPHDRWHEASREFIENNKDALFWSNLVNHEYHRKLNDIIDEIDDFLEASEDLLIMNQKDFVNDDQFVKYVLKETKECDWIHIKNKRSFNIFGKNTIFMKAFQESSLQSSQLI